MPRQIIFRCRLTEHERDVLLKYAEQKGVSTSEVVRDLIKTLERKVEKDK